MYMSEYPRMQRRPHSWKWLEQSYGRYEQLGWRHHRQQRRMSETPDIYTTAIMGSSVGRLGGGERVAVAVYTVPPSGSPEQPPGPNLRNDKCMLPSPAARPPSMHLSSLRLGLGGCLGFPAGGNCIHRHPFPRRLPGG